MPPPKKPKKGPTCVEHFLSEKELLELEQNEPSQEVEFPPKGTRKIPLKGAELSSKGAELSSKGAKKSPPKGLEVPSSEVEASAKGGETPPDRAESPPVGAVPEPEAPPIMGPPRRSFVSLTSEDRYPSLLVREDGKCVMHCSDECHCNTAEEIPPTLPPRQTSKSDLIGSLLNSDQGTIPSQSFVEALKKWGDLPLPSSSRATPSKAPSPRRLPPPPPTVRLSHLLDSQPPVERSVRGLLSSPSNDLSFCRAEAGGPSCRDPQCTFTYHPWGSPPSARQNPWRASSQAPPRTAAQGKPYEETSTKEELPSPPQRPFTLFREALLQRLVQNSAQFGAMSIPLDQQPAISSEAKTIRPLTFSTSLSSSSVPPSESLTKPLGGSTDSAVPSTSRQFTLGCPPTAVSAEDSRDTASCPVSGGDSSDDDSAMDSQDEGQKSTAPCDLPGPQAPNAVSSEEGSLGSILLPASNASSDLDSRPPRSEGSPAQKMPYPVSSCGLVSPGYTSPPITSSSAIVDAASPTYISLGSTSQPASYQQLTPPKPSKAPSPQFSMKDDPYLMMPRDGQLDEGGTPPRNNQGLPPPAGPPGMMSPSSNNGSQEMPSSTVEERKRTRNTGVAEMKLAGRSCQICDDAASGFHYGVWSCEGCKAFFKRSLQGPVDYVCPATQNCTIDRQRRKSCQACRLNKCIQMGMSRGNCRRERERSGNQSKATSRRKQSDDRPSPRKIRIKEEPEAQVSPPVAASPPEASSGSMPIHPLVEHLMRSDPPVRHSNHDPSLPDTRDSLMTSLLKLADFELMDVITWAKNVPGYSDLSLKMRIHMLEACWMEVLVMGLLWRSRQHPGCLIFAPDLHFDQHRIDSAEVGFTCNPLLKMAERFRFMNVTREEFVLLRMNVLVNAAILNPDEPEFSQVTELMEKMSEALEYTVVQRQRQPYGRIPALLAMLPHVRQVALNSIALISEVKHEARVPMDNLLTEMMEGVRKNPHMAHVDAPPPAGSKP